MLYISILHNADMIHLGLQIFLNILSAYKVLEPKTMHSKLSIT